MTKTGIVALFTGIIYSFVIGFICYQIGTMNPRQQVSGHSVDMPVVQAEKTMKTAEVDVILPQTEPEDVVYTIKEYNSRIGVYENDELIRIVNVDISSLRAQDVTMLRKGIQANTMEEVAEILEDYTS